MTFACSIKFIAHAFTKVVKAPKLIKYILKSRVFRQNGEWLLLYMKYIVSLVYFD